MKAETTRVESKGREQILSKEAEHADHALTMRGLSKSVDNATAVANAPCTDPFLSRNQKLLKLSFANLAVLLCSASQLLKPARKMKELNLLQKISDRNQGDYQLG